MTVRATVYALGEQPVHFERGTPTEHWTLLDQMRTEPVLLALTARHRGDQPEKSVNAVFQELLRAFQRQRVNAVLIGAYALAAHGLVRVTRDLEFWAQARPRNWKRVMGALQTLSVGEHRVLERLSAEHVQVVGNGWTVHVRSEAHGLGFAECVARAQDTDFHGVPLKLIALEDLIAMKRFAGRPQDLADVAMLELKKQQDAENTSDRALEND